MPEYTRLEKLRIELDMTYESLAADIGISLASLHNSIKGKTTPNARSAHKINRWLNENDTGGAK